MTVTPVLADQLEAAGRRRADAGVPAPPPVGGRRARRRRCRRGAAPGRRGRGRPLPPRRRAPGGAGRGGPGAPSRSAAASGPGRADGLSGDARGAAEARDARRAPAPGRRRPAFAHAAASARPRGFWLPECAYVPGLEAVLAERGVAYTCLDQSAHEPDGRGARPGAPARRAAGLHDRLADDRELVWAEGGYPGAPGYLEYHRLSAERHAALVDLGRALRPRAAAAEQADAEHAAPSSPRSRERLAAPRGEPRRARPLRVRDRHRAARALVGGGAALAGGGARRALRARASGC